MTTPRIAITSVDATLSARACARLAARTGLPVLGTDAGSIATPPAQFDAAAQFDAVRVALADFEQRTDTEAAPEPFLSDGSVLRHWARLHALFGAPLRPLEAIRRPGRVPDRIFLRGFVRAHQGIVIRHARVSYSAVVHFRTNISTPDAEAEDAALLAAAARTGRPLHVLTSGVDGADLDDLLDSLPPSMLPNLTAVPVDERVAP